MYPSFGLFETLLPRFEELFIKQAGIDFFSEDDVTMEAVARKGFEEANAPAQWTVSEHDFFIEYLHRDLRAESLAWFEKCAPIVRAFSCFVLGVLMGKFAAGELTDADFSLCQLHLPGFILLKTNQLCAFQKSTDH